MNLVPAKSHHSPFPVDSARAPRPPLPSAPSAAVPNPGLSWIRRRQRGALFGSWATLTLLLLPVLLVACGDDGATSTPDPERLPLGVHVLQRGAPGGDPLLVEAFADLQRAGFSYGQFEIEWGAVEQAIGFYDWRLFDDHVRQGLNRGIPLSVVITLVDGPQLGRFPDDLRGQSLGSANVRVRFGRFLKDLQARGRGTVQRIWVGRNIDQLLAGNEPLQTEFRETLAAGRDSLIAAGGGPDVGTIFTAGDEVPTELVDFMVPELDRLGWAVFGTDGSLEQVLSPQELTDRIALVVAGDRRLPTSVVETGFRRDSVEDAADFASRLTQYLEDAPGHLEEVTWFALYDFEQSEAEVRAARIFPGDAGSRADLIEWLRVCGLGEVSGVPTQVWTVLADWNAGF